MSTIKSSTEHLTLNADGSGKDLKLQTNGTERMRIDSSGNVLVGKTASDLATGGQELKSSGASYFTRSAGSPIFANRLSSDGDIIDFRKDGTTVGSIGTLSSLLTIGNSGTTGLIFDANEMYPVQASTGAAQDATKTLGAPTARFKDAYLSGGVYLGGTGSANKLDDYEEGTFAPALDGISGWSTNTQGRYTKIGNVVHFTILLHTNSGVTGTNNGIVTGLPFSNSFQEGIAHVTLSRTYGEGMSNADYTAIVDSSSRIFFRVTSANNTALTFAPATTCRLGISGTYITG